MERIGLIKPEYVWITTGTGRWTNRKSAEALAKRDAGINTSKLIEVLGLENNPVTVIGKDEFIELSSNSKHAYMYGNISYVQLGEAMNGEISVINTDDWSGVTYSTYSGDKKEVPYSEKNLILEYETFNKKLAPKPVTKTVRMARNDPYNEYCLVVAAMIIGEPV